jgi:uncharacterized DUF497 family protein
MHVAEEVFWLGGLQFTWDRAQNISNARKHGIAFEEAATTWLDALALERFDEAHSRDEDRWIRLGMSLRATLLVTWWTVREGPGAELIRIIGSRKATSAERRLYETFS